MWMLTSSLMPFNTTTNDAVRMIADGLYNGALHIGMQQVNTGSFNDPQAVTSSAFSQAVYTTMVYAFTDSLQATHPVFIRVQFRNKTNAGGAPGLTCQVGTTHNGNGDIGGVLSRLYILEWVSGGPLVPATALVNTVTYGTAADGVFAQNVFVGGSSRTRFIIVERTRTGIGDINNVGLNICMGGQSSPAGTEYIHFATSSSIVHDNQVFVIRSPASLFSGGNKFAGFQNGNTSVGKLFNNDGQMLPQCFISTVIIDRSDINIHATIAVDLYGSTTGSFFAMNEMGSMTGFSTAVFCLRIK